MKRFDPDERVFPDPVIIPLDALREKLAMVPFDLLRTILAAQALHLVTAEEKAVLDAMAALPSYVVRFRAERQEPEYVAELARREGKP